MSTHPELQRISDIIRKHISTNPDTQRISDIVRKHRPDLDRFEDEYRRLHQIAELPGQTHGTAHHVASFLRGLGFDAITLANDTAVAAVFSNGDGKTIMIRGELYALDLDEPTDLVVTKSRRHRDARIQLKMHAQTKMHACGHDLHMACIMATAQLLSSAKGEWDGKLVIVLQGDIRGVSGAQGLVASGLYSHVPVPDIVLGQHSGPFAAGTLKLPSGPVVAAYHRVVIKVYGNLEYAANPQINIEFSDLFLDIIDELHKLAKSEKKGESRIAHIDAGDLSFDHSLDNEPFVEFKLQVDSATDDAFFSLLPKIQELVTKQSDAANVHKDPEIEVIHVAPMVQNSEPHAATLQKSFTDFFGGGRLKTEGTMEESHHGEDISYLVAPFGRPCVFWFFGRAAPGDCDAWYVTQSRPRDADFLRKVPLNGSPCNVPDLRPSLQTGTDSMAVAALTFLMEEKEDKSEVIFLGGRRDYTS